MICCYSGKDLIATQNRNDVYTYVESSIFRKFHNIACVISNKSRPTGPTSTQKISITVSGYRSTNVMGTDTKPRRKENENKNLEYSNLFLVSFFSSIPSFRGLHRRLPTNCCITTSASFYRDLVREGDPKKQVLFDRYGRARAFESRSMCPPSCPTTAITTTVFFAAHSHSPVRLAKCLSSVSLKLRALTFASNGGPRIETRTPEEARSGGCDAAIQNRTRP